MVVGSLTVTKYGLKDTHLPGAIRNPYVRGYTVPVAYHPCAHMPCTFGGLCL